MSNTNIREKFVEWLKKRIGCIYVWGGQGETCISEAWIRRMEDNADNAERVITFWKKQLKAGIKEIAAYDCSGLITDFLIENGIIHSDMTSRGLYAICDKINRSYLAMGDLVFRHNGESIYHVGVYIGDGLVIHARGRDYGVVEEKLDANGESYWNKFGRITNMPLVKDNVSVSDAPKEPRTMRYTGDTYVNLRSRPDSSASDNVIGRVSAGDTVLMLSEAENSWCEVIVRCSDGFKRGYCVKSWLTSVRSEEF